MKNSLLSVIISIGITKREGQIYGYKKQCIRVGEIELALKAGVITEDAIVGEFGDILCGNVVGRENDQETTMFDATGLYILDLVAAKVAITKAKEAGMGLEVEM